MSTTTKKTVAKTATKKGANATSKKGANATSKKGANATSNAKGNNSRGMKPSEMAKSIGLTRVGFNQWKNTDGIVVARTDGNKLTATKKGAELKFDPMAEVSKVASK